MLSRLSASILPTPRLTIGTTFITDCRSTRHLDRTPDLVTGLGSIGGGWRHERPVSDTFHGNCCDRPSPFYDRGNDTALHMERIKQRSDRPLSYSSYDTF